MYGSVRRLSMFTNVAHFLLALFLISVFLYSFLIFSSFKSFFPLLLLILHVATAGITWFPSFSRSDSAPILLLLSNCPTRLTRLSVFSRSRWLTVVYAVGWTLCVCVCVVGAWPKWGMSTSAHYRGGRRRAAHQRTAESIRSQRATGR